VGLWQLARAGGLVRRLPAVETLGSTTVICSDKTGTMTENQMTVVRLALDGRAISVGGGSQAASGAFTSGGAEISPTDNSHLALLLTASALVNDATLVSAPDGVHLSGDPTEAALLVAAAKGGLNPAALAQVWPRRREIPFDPARRMMATYHDMPDGGPAVFVKGSPSVVLDLSAERETAFGPRPLTEPDRREILDVNRTLAADGLRVLGVAWRSISTIDVEADELIFLGLVGLADPIRPGVREAVAACRDAGIRTIMITGDQRATAEAVGRSLGLAPDAVRSRVSPDQKLALIEELQAQGEIVAMTGDGVNDAPALARADIGVAMGRHGTDVARDAADLVLTDDNFATIVKAIAQGRVIYANLRKVIYFLFSSNVSEIVTIFAAILLGFPSPLPPLQILWVNLVTDILPALALIRDPAEPDLMRRPPRDPREALITWRFGRRTLAEGAVLAAGVLSAYLWIAWRDGAGASATTMAFMVIVLIHPLQALHCRSQRRFWWQLPSNPLIWLVLLALIGIQSVAVSVAPLAHLLGTAPLRRTDWPVLVAGLLWPVTLLEVAKVWRR
jgi:Ca2+-transporting ATPase